ncbi:polysaccharide biosynthesis tyrosine autokinase [Gordonia hongkongensis]|uniref:polysaccharide biosynthesis tyrosine autokinase n=1 Tax=Gordonia hongkongensis TaxID=1701090 RepID=UPI003D70390A
MSVDSTLSQRFNESLDVRRTGRGLLQNWFILVIGALVGGVLAISASLISTPMYQATASFYVTSGVDADALSAYQGSLASQQRVLSYAELVTSEVIVSDALKNLPIGMSVDEAIDSLKAETATDTVIVRIMATTPSTRESLQLANAVADSMVTYVGELERPTGGGAPLAKLTVVSPAKATEDPVSPKTMRNTIVAMLVGVLVGVLVILARLRLDTRVRKASDLEDIVSSPTLSIVPSEPALSGTSVLDFGRGASPAAEAYRRLRTNLAFADVDRPTRHVMVASARASEGKTSTAINLCVALAESGARVLLVDADLRKPDVARRMGVNEQVGLTNLLRGDAPVDDLAQPSGVSGLDVLASGASVPNPVELLGSQRAATAFASMKSSYDHVIVDTPPLLPVTDAAVIGQYVDGAIVVVRADRSRKPDVVTSVSMLRSANVKVLGLVLNDTTDVRSGYGEAYYGREVVLDG